MTHRQHHGYPVSAIATHESAEGTVRAAASASPRGNGSIARLGKLFARFGAACAAFILAASCFALAGCQTNSGEQAGGNAQGQASSAARSDAAVGSPAPELDLALADGSSVTLSSLQGSTVFLSFWGTWCPYCISDMPDLQRVKDEVPGVEVVLVNCGEDAQTVSDFAAEKGYDFLWALDEDYAAQMAYPSSGIPYTVVIAPDGTVANIFAGSSRSGMYEKFLEAAQNIQ